MELIVDNKKISIKHYLNFNLKPSNPDDTVDMYPLYSQVVYDSKSTKFRTFASLKYLGAGYGYAKRVEPKILDGSFLDEMEELRKTDEAILKIVRYEIKKYKSEFTLKGLSKRFLVYGSPVLSTVSNSLRLSMDYFFGSKFTHNEFLEIFGQRKPYGKLVLEALEKNPELLDEMPKEYQYYSVISMLVQYFEEKNQDQILCYDLLIDMQKKSEFYEQIRQHSKMLKPDSIFLPNLSDKEFDVFFSVIPTYVDEALRATKK